MAKKININLTDYPWQLELASQRLTLIKKALGIKTRSCLDEMDLILDDFEGVRADKKGNFEYSSGFLTVRGYIDSKTKEQKVDFLFNIASN